MVDVGLRLLHSLAELRYPIAEDKCRVITTSDGLSCEVAKALGIQWCRSAVHLGTTTCNGRLRRVGKSKQRRVAAVRKLKKVVQLRCAGAKPLRVLRAGPTA
eukprot:6202975-Amphidinium_carterae.4